MSWHSPTDSPAAPRAANPRPGLGVDLEPGKPFRWSPGAAALPNSNLIFVGYLLLVGLEYSGVHNEVGLLKAMRVTTVLGYVLFILVVVRVGLVKAFAARQVRLLAVLVMWTAASVLWAFVQTYAFNAIRPLFEYLMFTVVTAHVVDRRSRLDKLAWVFGLVAVLLVVRNSGKLGNSQRVGAFAAPYFLGDGNDFAWGLITLAPIILWLAISSGGLLRRSFGLLGAGVCVLGAIGTQSRGGSLGLATAVLYGYFFIVRRKAIGAFALLLLAAGVFIISPSGYVDRMGTVASYDQDNSAQIRLQAWGAATRMAVEHPLGVGAGNFNSAYGRWYNPSTGGGGDSRVGWGRLRWVSPHSIYFKTLGEYGFAGTALLVWVIIASVIDNARSRRALKAVPQGAPFEERWPALLTMSLVGFAVSGVFLGGLGYPHLFLLSGLIIGVSRVVALEAAQATMSSRV